MKPMRLVFAILVSVLILYVWSFATQFLPWGVPSAQTISTASKPDVFSTPSLIRMEPNELTTPKFDETMVGKVSTLETAKTFSWIVSVPMQAYDPGRYLVFEFITQLLASVAIVALLALSATLAPIKRQGIVFIASFGVSAAIYGQFANWWGLPFLYSVGAAVNLIIGWNLSAFALRKTVYREVNRGE